MATVKWQWTADYLQACNCDWGCLCNWNAPPTKGYCHGFGAYQIRSGHYGDVELDGLHAAFTAKWPGQIHEGGGVGTLYIDERADPNQRGAFVQIMSGQAGGLPFEILAATLARMLDPLFVPFEFKLAGPHSSGSIGTVAKGCSSRSRARSWAIRSRARWAAYRVPLQRGARDLARGVHGHGPGDPDGVPRSERALRGRGVRELGARRLTFWATLRACP